MIGSDPSAVRDWVGGSAILGPGRYPPALAEAGGRPQTLLTRCEFSHARDKSTSPVNNVVADRRPELYGRLRSPQVFYGGALTFVSFDLDCGMQPHRI